MNIDNSDNYSTYSQNSLMDNSEKLILTNRIIHKKMEVERALALLEEGKITISKAAEIAGIGLLEFIKKIKKAKIKWVSEEIIKKDLEAFKS